MTPVEFALGAFAAHRLTIIVTADKITAPLRARAQKATGSRRAYLVTCPWCVGIYAGALLALLWWLLAGHQSREELWTAGAAALAWASCAAILSSHYTPDG